MADLLGFQAFEKTQPGSEIKPGAESNLPDIIGTNLEYAAHAYEWTTHMPMTEDGVIVSGFWDREKEPMPEGYGIEGGGFEEVRWLRKVGGQACFIVVIGGFKWLAGVLGC